MAYKIVWTLNAELTFEAVINYLEFAWGEKQIINFLKASEKIIQKVSQFPHSFRTSKYEAIHEVLITKHNLMIYEVIENKKFVVIHAIWDTRQNPKKKPSKFKTK